MFLRSVKFVIQMSLLRYWIVIKVVKSPNKLIILALRTVLSVKMIIKVSEAEMKRKWSEKEWKGVKIIFIYYYLLLSIIIVILPIWVSDMGQLWAIYVYVGMYSVLYMGDKNFHSKFLRIKKFMNFKNDIQNILNIFN